MMIGRVRHQKNDTVPIHMFSVECQRLVMKNNLW